MGAPKWLSKLGEVAKVGSVLLGGPAGAFLAAAIPGKKDDVVIERAFDSLEQIAKVVMAAEQFGQAWNIPGSQRLEGVAPHVGDIIKHSALFTGVEFQDQALYDADVKAIAHHMASLLNNVKH